VSTRYEPDREALATLLAGEPRYRVDQVWHGLYDELAAPEDMTSLPKALRARLDAELPGALREVTRRVNDGGDTVKQLWSLDGGAAIESVLMLYPDRVTVCVSSQAGCAMGCGFCATGQAGFERHLTVGEIVEQVVAGAREARAMGRRLGNVVFMGMGEPLANEANVWSAVERIHGGLGLSARHLTISTVGLVPGINRLAERPLPVNLAVSLHAANDELRDELVPINTRWKVDEAIDAAYRYYEATGRRVSIEYALIRDINDQAWRADLLGEKLAARGRGWVHVNPIPLNPTPGSKWTASRRGVEQQFVERLRAHGIPTTIRDTRGQDIDGACGQLAASTA
jgi:23S rRNA (adenine2503-C2)-methyltransferase